MPISKFSLKRGPSLQMFHEAAAHSTGIYLRGDRLIAAVTDAAGHPGATGSSGLAGDATTALIQALHDAVGPRLANAIARELDLSPSPGMPLQAQVIERAVTMAREGQWVLEGVDFITRLHLSAVEAGHDFIRICARMDIDPQLLADELRHTIDARLAERFSAAARAGQMPVTLEDGERWLVEILQDIAPRSD